MNYEYLPAKTSEISVTDAGSLTYNIEETGVSEEDFDGVWFTLLDSEENPTSSIYPMTITKTDDTHSSVTPTGSYLPAGTFQVLAHKPMGYAVSDPSTFTVSFSTEPTTTPVSSSFLGGK